MYETPSAPVGVNRHRQPVREDHVPQCGHDGQRRFAGPQLRVEHPLGRIIEDGDQHRPLGRPQRQPAVRAAVNVQQFAETGPGLAPAPMAAPRAMFLHQSGGLQSVLQEAIGHGDPVLPLRHLVKVADVKARVPLAI